MAMMLGFLTIGGQTQVQSANSAPRIAASTVKSTSVLAYQTALFGQMTATGQQRCPILGFQHAETSFRKGYPELGVPTVDEVLVNKTSKPKGIYFTVRVGQESIAEGKGQPQDNASRIGRSQFTGAKQGHSVLGGGTNSTLLDRSVAA
jgi:hypothetical protein